MTTKNLDLSTLPEDIKKANEEIESISKKYEVKAGPITDLTFEELKVSGNYAGSFLLPTLENPDIFTKCFLGIVYADKVTNIGGDENVHGRVVPVRTPYIVYGKFMSQTITDLQNKITENEFTIKELKVAVDTEKTISKELRIKSEDIISRIEASEKYAKILGEDLGKVRGKLALAQNQLDTLKEKLGTIKFNELLGE